MFPGERVFVSAGFGDFTTRGTCFDLFRRFILNLENKKDFGLQILSRVLARESNEFLNILSGFSCWREPVCLNESCSLRFCKLIYDAVNQNLAFKDKFYWLHAPKLSCHFEL